MDMARASQIKAETRFWGLLAVSSWSAECVGNFARGRVKGKWLEWASWVAGGGWAWRNEGGTGDSSALRLTFPRMRSRGWDEAQSRVATREGGCGDDDESSWRPHRVQIHASTPPVASRKFTPCHAPWRWLAWYIADVDRLFCSFEATTRKQREHLNPGRKG
jgi:hypothetical protein